MPEKKPVSCCGVTLLALGFALAALPAQAGFEWVSPNSVTPVQTAPAPTPAPYAPMAATARPEVISPVVISGDSRPVANPVVISSSAPPAPVALPPVPVTPISNNLATATLSVAPQAESADEIVRGFANQVPLALALRQILPAGMNFSIDQDISMDTLVSYKGGKNWRDTLNDMLAAVALVPHEQGHAVTVSRVAASVPVAASASSVPAFHSLAAPAPVIVMPQAEMPTVNVGLADGWTAQRGDTLRKVLTAWCHRANTELQWQAEYDYPVEASAHFNGGFEDAVRNLLAGFDGAQPQPIGELHTNPGAGQMVLVVHARGNSYVN